MHIFHSTSIIQNDFSDVSTTRCAPNFSNFPDKRLKRSLLFRLRFQFFDYLQFQYGEVVAQSCSVKNLIFKISQNPQENTCLGVSFNKVADLQYDGEL